MKKRIDDRFTQMKHQVNDEFEEIKKKMKKNMNEKFIIVKKKHKRRKKRYRCTQARCQESISSNRREYEQTQ
jgi:hypothetical protein